MTEGVVLYLPRLFPSYGYADEAVVPMADESIRVLDDLLHNARWDVKIGDENYHLKLRTSSNIRNQ